MNVRVDGDRLFIEGDLDAKTVPGLFEAGMQGVRDGVKSVDFSKVASADSSAIAMTLALLREVEAAGGRLQLLNIPPTMLKLARLYAIEDVLHS